MDLGATPWVTFRRITLPLIKNGIVVGAAVAFILSFSEFTLSYYLAGERQTLPIYVFSEFKYLITPKINALSATVVALVIVVTLLTEAVRHRAAALRRR
jgi:spermidine/putrescine transport system permease protein